MDDPKRQFIFLGVIAALVAAFYMYGELQGEPPADESTRPAGAEGAEGSEPAEEGATPAAPGAPSGLEGSPLFTPAPSREVQAAREDAEQRFSITTDLYAAEFSNLNTGLVHYELRADRFVRDGHPIEIVTTDKERYFPFRPDFVGVAIPEDAVWQGEQLSPTSVRFTWAGDGFEIVRLLEAGEGDYKITATVTVRNTSTHERFVQLRYFTHHWVTSDDESGGIIGRPSTALSHGICAHELEGDVEVDRYTGDDLQEDPVGFGTAIWAGTHDSFFSNIVVDLEGRAERCVLAAQERGGVGTLFEAQLRYAGQRLGAGEELQEQTFAYLGPNDRQALVAAGHHLDEVIDLGWFSFIADGLTQVLDAIQSVVGNWGFAIILLTILVKLLFYPLTMKSFRSMAGMRKLKPKIDAINEKYADDREKKGAAMMELYRKEGINPASGCLPSLLQMPVWFALYRSLSTNIELYNAPFLLWWTDLSAPDPYFVLPGLVAVLMHLQQRFTPTTMDPAQAKMMMYFMPLVIGAFMLFLPAGLCLYMVTNSSLTMIQQRIIYAKLDRESETDEGEDEGEPEPTDGDDDDESGEEAAASAESGSSSSTVRRRRTAKTRKKRQKRGRA